MSENPKQKDQEVQNVEESSVNLSRFANSGKLVTLSFGEFTVRELTIFEVISLMSDGLAFFVVSFEGKSYTEILQILAKDLETQKQISRIFATICQSPEKHENFLNMTMKDFTTLIRVVKEVIDFQELNEAFLELGLQKYLPQAPISTE
jgi:hypothetical protein